MSEIYDKLNQAALDLSKTSKISHKLHDQAMSIPIDERRPRINQGASELLTLMMEADAVQSELSLMIRYKKSERQQCAHQPEQCTEWPA